MSKVLITGGAGFIGSHITDELIKLNYKTVILDKARGNINAKSKYYKADITNAEKIKKIFLAEKPDFVIHNAAQINVRESVKNTAFDANTNIIGTINVLNAAVSAGVKKIVFASSGGTVYGECSTPARESFSVNPYSPYGIAKASAENYIKFYASLNAISYVILRYSNVFGPRQDPRGEAGVIAIFSEAMVKGVKINIFGDGKQIRDYVYVKDVVRANILALKYKKNDTFNIGSGKGTSVNVLAKMMSELSGYKQKPVYLPKRAGELTKNVLDIKKAAKLLKWAPKANFKTALKETMGQF
jgi:UDP-glucose 4-epimerase